MLRSQCAAAVNCSPETVRYYERIELIDPPRRNSAGYRQYDDHHLEQLSFIRTARELGFDMDAIRKLLALYREQSAPCDEADVLVQQHLDHVDEKIRRFQALRRVLKSMLEACPGDVVADCSVFRSLTRRG